MSRTVNQRLRRIDQKIADRIVRKKLGDLQMRLYYTPTGQATFEVSVFEAKDLGLSNKSPVNGLDIQARRTQFGVNRDFWDQYTNVTGKYTLTFADGDAPIPLELEQQRHQEGDTFCTLTFRIAERFAV